MVRCRQEKPHTDRRNTEPHMANLTVSGAVRMDMNLKVVHIW